MKSLYHSLRATEGVTAARNLARTVLGNNRGNVSKAARILGCSRLCVRRAREGPLEDYSREPHHQPRKTQESMELFVLDIRQQTGYGKRRLKKHLKAKYGFIMKEDTVAKILKRGNVKKQVYKRSGKASKPLYDYENLIPFEEGQVDTKHVEDFGALGRVVFNLRRYGLPRYQWTYICAKTKIRFLAYSHSLEGQYGLLFLSLVTLWLRSCGVGTALRFQGDNGSEFCAGSKEKEVWLNEMLKPWDASFRSIPAGKKYLQGIVERSHRTDDEELYRPHLERIKSTEIFFRKAQMWQDTYNALRPSWGVGMKGKTPLQKLKQSAILVPEQILHFPVIILDDLLRVLKTGNYLCNYYQMRKYEKVMRVIFFI